jgi:hypothetical protein
MSRLHQFIFACVAAVTFQLSAQTPPIFPGQTDTNLVPPPIPKLPSPVNFFRQLLAMSPVERLAALTNRPPEARAKILAKVREYQALSPDERELRLRATELRWYLTPLLRVPATERAARLANVPEELRELVQSRLQQWDILPPPLQKECLASDQALHYFARVETTNQPATTPAQEKIGKQFNQFFEFTPAEKQQTLKTLSAAERAQMEKTLQTFDKLPPKQRLTCLRNYAKFAGMSATERAEFLKNAESWSKMSPAERQTWRDLVARVPQWPPMPPATVPPNLIPHVSPKIPRTSVATNLN